MNSKNEIPPNKTTALLAYILDIGTARSADRAILEGLVDAICTDEVERSRLISAVALAQNPEIRPQVLELLGRRLDRLRNALEEVTDQDDIMGVWSQRVAGGVILAGGGAVLGGLLDGAAAAVALVLSLTSGFVTTLGRKALRRRARTARRACEETERLVTLLSAAG